jgi:pimeloyl-ACP methyl ester carboxylesterase
MIAAVLTEKGHNLMSRDALGEIKEGTIVSIKKGYIDTRDGQLHYRVSEGGKGLPLVLLHQTASSSQMYEKLMTELQGQYRMFALDTPGFGQSFFPPQPPTLGYYVSLLLDALQSLGVKEFHLFGHHTGAAIACEMAATAPERVRTLTMVGPVYMDAAERQKWIRDYVKAMVIEPDGSHLMKIWKRVSGLDPDPNLALCHREAVDNLRAGERYHEAYLAVFNQDFPAFLSQVRCPILMLCGEHDVLMPYFKPSCEARPDAKSVILPGGTYVVDDYPGAIAKELVAFLREKGEA